MAPAAKAGKQKTAPSSARPTRSRNVIVRLISGWFRQPGRFLVAALGIGVLAALPAASKVLPDLSTQAEYQFELRTATVSDGHRWLPARLAEQVWRGAGMPERVSLLEPNLAETIAHAWQRSPWVREVKSVRIVSGGIRIELEYRVPVALVEVVVEGQSGVYPVDQAGTLLPPGDFSVADIERLPHIRGIASQPRSGAGAPWGDERVEQAARLAAVLTPQQDVDRYWNPLGLVAIVAPPRQLDAGAGAAPAFELAMKNGNRIVWGQAPGQDTLEQPVDQKLTRLQWLAERGKLNAPGGPWSIDIRPFGDQITQLPLRSTL